MDCSSRTRRSGIPLTTFSTTRATPGTYLPAAPATAGPVPAAGPAAAVPPATPSSAVDDIIEFVRAKAFVFEPWQVAAYVSAVRTKPFVILAGISGTGKSKLPELVAEATSATIVVEPVLPSWTDSSDLIGYERLNGTFVAGRLLLLAEEALKQPDKQFFLLLDEMNVARVEYYLAEVLSRIEQRAPVPSGRFVSQPLLPPVAGGQPDPAGLLRTVGLPSNLCIVGSVNMDETTHGFSRKVLDRSFVIEFSDIDLAALRTISTAPVTPWSASDWQQVSLTLAAHPNVGRPVVQDVVQTLTALNAVLAPAQLQVGYRVRDEIAMFALVAEEYAASFQTAATAPVDPVDLAVAMKVLPRIQGGGAVIRKVLKDLKAWASPPAGSSSTRAFPFCEARIDMMQSRLDEAGITSYWL